MKIHSGQKVLCVCRAGQVRSVATRFILSSFFGFKKVLCAGWESNDTETLNTLYEWADVVIVVGRPSDWRLSTPHDKTIWLEIGEDVYGYYHHTKLLELLMPKITSLVKPRPDNIPEECDR